MEKENWNNETNALSSAFGKASGSLGSWIDSRSVGRGGARRWSDELIGDAAYSRAFADGAPKQLTRSARSASYAADKFMSLASPLTCSWSQVTRHDATSLVQRWQVIIINSRVIRIIGINSGKPACKRVAQRANF